jgi:hypothetical protein
MISSCVQTMKASHEASLQDQIAWVIEDLLAWLPDCEQLTAHQRRGIIARYTAVLEGNFIYWMTGAYISITSEDARAIILDNLLEEIRDCHPGMLRRFAIAAHAVPTDTDAQAVYESLSNVRAFVGSLSGVRIVLMMAFFEGFLQRFMAFLTELAERQGSTEQEYTIVHGVCDIAHTEGLYRAIAAEMALDPPEPGTYLLDGVDLLRNLIQNIVDPDAVELSVGAISTSNVTLNQGQVA